MRFILILSVTIVLGWFMVSNATSSAYSHSLETEVAQLQKTNNAQAEELNRLRYQEICRDSAEACMFIGNMQ